MSVLVDTSVWSLVLRRERIRNAPIERELTELIREGRVALVGPVRQEILSGLRDENHFRELRNRLRAFPDVRIRASDYEEAAVCFNRCRQKGLQGSSTDFLICAVSLGRGTPVFTIDKDFDGFAKVLPLKLHRPRS